MSVEWLRATVARIETTEHDFLGCRAVDETELRTFRDAIRDLLRWYRLTWSRAFDRVDTIVDHNTWLDWRGDLEQAFDSAERHWTLKAATMPGYWMNETGPILQPAVHAYLRGEDLDNEQLGAFRAYLRQWMLEMRGPGAAELRERIDAIVDVAILRRWLYDALDYGIDPL